MAKASKTMTKAQLIAKHNRQLKYKRLPAELTILVVGIMVLLHQTGILVMVAGHSHVI